MISILFKDNNIIDTILFYLAGFFAGLAGKVQEMTMVRLMKPSAIGCAFLAAKKAGVHLDIDFTSNYEVFCHFKCTSH